jgi:6-hydroxy-3-succinoylpyridine 3-monooxygenase
MLDDLYQSKCERFVLLSGDSDLVPAIELVFTRLPAAKVNVYIPVPANKAGARERSYKKELRNVSTTVRALPPQLLPLSLFGDPVLLADGTSVSMPNTWSAAKGPRPFMFAPPATGQCTWCGKT